MSLLPEKPLTFSPQLAATLGLDEAILLQVLLDITLFTQPDNRHGQQWHEVTVDQLTTAMPFWQSSDIQRVATNLLNQGLLSTDSPPATESGVFRFSLLTGKAARTTAKPTSEVTKRTNRIGARWQPEKDVVAQLNQYGIPDHFISQQLPEFITYWSERGEAQYSWGSKFIKHVLRQWRTKEADDAKSRREQPMQSEWRPSNDAVDILCNQAGISRNFVEDAIPEFVLYWRDRGTESSTWNSRFVQHVRRQWLRYSVAIEHESEPGLIPDQWRPTEDLYEVVKLANIPRTFAEAEIPNFVLYWRETKQAHNSWNTKFLQHVKRQWAYQQASLTEASSAEREHGKQQRTDKPVSTRHRSLVEDLSDRSWAS
ncbi:MAG: DnaT-like ssDNA-binding domain-containing protein [bacterium]